MTTPPDKCPFCGSDKVPNTLDAFAQYSCQTVIHFYHRQQEQSDKCRIIILTQRLDALEQRVKELSDQSKAGVFSVFNKP